jgi:hypothetical protein
VEEIRDPIERCLLIAAWVLDAVRARVEDRVPEGSDVVEVLFCGREIVRDIVIEV